MDGIENRRQQAIDACEKVINGIEDGTITVSSTLLLCKRIARLVNDVEGQEWLDYEYGGYPRDDTGYIKSEAWKIADKHGRTYLNKKESGKYEKVMFVELCSELEEIINGERASINNFTTQGFSVSGEYALASTERMTARVAERNNYIIRTIQEKERNLSILKAQYYDYAVKWKIELCFGNMATSIFDKYRENVDSFFNSFSIEILRKLNSINSLKDDDNPERYAQILTSCRRLWSDIAKDLFNKVLPDFKGKTFKTQSGKEIDVSGDHINNKLSAVIETLQNKSVHNTLVGSEIIYLIDWLEQINNMQSTGVHADVTKEQAMQCIIHTYIAIGDILTLKDKAIKGT